MRVSANVSYSTNRDDLQYVSTAAGLRRRQRFVLGRISQRTWSLTVRANLTLTPNLSLQYYGSPFVSTGRYGGFKRATDTQAQPLPGPLPRLRRGRARLPRRRQRLRRRRGRRARLLVRQSRLQLPAVPLEPGAALGVPAGLLALRRLVAGPHRPAPGLGVASGLQLERALARSPRQRASWSSSATGSRRTPGVRGQKPRLSVHVRSESARRRTGSAGASRPRVPPASGDPSRDRRPAPCPGWRRSSGRGR